jgi:hypothetical protein
MNGPLRVNYMSDGTIYVVDLPSDPGHSAKLVSTWAIPQLHECETYAGLSRGANGTVLFHGSWVAQSSGEARVRTELIEADVTTREVSVVPLNISASFLFPVLSQSGAFVAGTAHVDGKDIVAVLSRSSGDVHTFEYLRSASPHAWSEGDESLLVTTIDESKQDWEVLRLDLRSGTFKRVSAGGRPIFSSDTGLVATLASDYASIVVSNTELRINVVLHGFFKTISQWIVDTKLLYVTGTGYVDSLGIADVENGTLREYSLPSKGEIRGACCAT